MTGRGCGFACYVPSVSVKTPLLMIERLNRRVGAQQCGSWRDEAVVAEGGMRGTRPHVLCPAAPYPFGQIKHLACKVEGNPRGLTYNHQVVGIHPAIRFGSL